MKKKIGFILAAVLLIALISGSGFWLGFRAGEKFPQNLVIKEVGNISQGQPQGVDFSTFWQAWQVINDNYLNNKKINPQDKIYGAISGLVNSLDDPYSVFLSPEDNKKFQQDIQGNFGGIGAEIGVKDHRIVIIAPLKDTPASHAGLKPNDEVLEIDSTSTVGMTIDQAVSLIRGPEGTPVTLTISREGWDKPDKIIITRSVIIVPTVEFKMVDGNLAYVQLESFNANTEYLFYQATIKALTGGAKGVVLDLRDDPGGYLDVAVDLAGWFLRRGTLVVSEASSQGTIQELRANGNQALVNIPIVVIINGGSASASEILAGSLRDNRQIKLIGEKSFGKGTVQELLPLKDDSFLKLTIAHWVLPSGKILEKNGLEPDIEVKMTDDDIKNKRDPQLDKAIGVLKSEITR